MNDTPTLDDLDDLERDIVRTLRAKADQLPVDDGPFEAGARPVAALRGPASPLTSRRRILALAAAVAVLGGAVVAAQRLGSGDDTDSTGPDAVAAAPEVGVYRVPESGPAAFLPETVPEGWELREVNAGHYFGSSAHETTWQLFGADGPSPLARGVLVSSVGNVESGSGRIVDGVVHEIGEEPIIAPTDDPTAPDGTPEATWLDGGVLHRALARGMSEAELRAFVASLVPNDDPTTGFESAGSDLPLLETSTVGEQQTSGVTYVGPAGAGDTIRVTAFAPDDHGGLLHRLVGEPGDDGPLIRGASSGDGDYPFVSRARQDGWTIEVLSQASPTVAADPMVLDDFLEGLQPVTRDELVDVVAAEPVSTTGTAGDWSVEVHGSAGAVALCFTGEGGESDDGGEEVCTTVESWTLPGMVTASALVGDQWVVAVVHDEAIEPMVSAAREDQPGAPPSEEDRFQGEAGHVDDGRVVEVVTVPADVDSVAVTVFLTPDAAESESTMRYYVRPPG